MATGRRESASRRGGRTRARLALVAGVLSLGLGTAGPLRAAERTPLFMLDFVPQGGQVKPRVVQKLTEFLRGELESLPAYLLFPADDIQRLAEGRESRFAQLGLQAMVQEIIEQARADYLNLMFDKALANFERARELLTRDGARARDFDTLVDTLLQVANVQLALGRGKAAQASLTAVFQLRPEHQVDTTEFPPNLVNRAKLVGKKVRKAKTGRIALDSEPGFARVVLDGREVGETPLLLKKISPGTHYLCLEQAERRSHCEALVLKPGQKAELSVQLEPNPTVAAFRDLFEQVAEGALREPTLLSAGVFGQAVGADWILIGGVAEDAGGLLVSVALVDGQRGDTLRRIVAPLDADLDALQEVTRSLARALATPPVDAGPTALVVADLQVSRPEQLDFDTYLLGISSRGAATALVTAVGQAPPATAGAGAASPVEEVSAYPAVEGEAGLATPPPEPGSEPAVGVAEDEWYEAWWLWTLVGVVVAGGAVTAGLLLAPPAEDEKNTVNARINFAVAAP